MFNSLFKEYKKNHLEYKFNTYYIICSLILLPIYYILTQLNINITVAYLFLLITLSINVILFFMKDFKKICKDNKLSIKNINYYLDKKDKLRIQYLNKLLRKRNINSKSDIKLVIDYFNSEKRVRVQKNISETILSISLSFFSLMQITYDNSTNTIDINRLISFFSQTAGLLIMILIGFITLKIIFNSIFRINDITNDLYDDLTRLYLNRNKKTTE